MINFLFIYLLVEMHDWILLLFHKTDLCRFAIYVFIGEAEDILEGLGIDYCLCTLMVQIEMILGHVP